MVKPPTCRKRRKRSKTKQTKGTFLENKKTRRRTPPIARNGPQDPQYFPNPAEKYRVRTKTRLLPVRHVQPFGSQQRSAIQQFHAVAKQGRECRWQLP